MSGEVMGDDTAGQHGPTATGTILIPGTMQEAPPTETGSEGGDSSYNADY